MKVKQPSDILFIDQDDPKERSWSLAAVNPELAKEWHPTKNGDLRAEDVTPGSNKKIWWRCKKNHEWEEFLSNRNRENNNCPYCSGHRVCSDNCLSAVNPELAKEWHPTKNGDLRAEDVTPGSNKKVWWKCENGHEWKAMICLRKNKKGVCHKCKSFSFKNPELTKEWHPTKNGNLKAEEVSFGSKKRVWWLGVCGHEWDSSVSNRAIGAGCPFCIGRRIEWMPFEQARDAIRRLKLKSNDEFIDKYKSGELPLGIPRTPHRVYKVEWVSMGDWLGTGYIAPQNRVYKPFKKARSFVRNLKLKSQKEWKNYCKSVKPPQDIPLRPDAVYKTEWVSFGDWLGTGSVHKKDFLPFEEARAFVHKLYLKTQGEWLDYSKSGKLPTNIPKDPRKPYKLKWVSMSDWLGNGNISLQERHRLKIPFIDARDFARNLGLKSRTYWAIYCKSGKRPIGLPSQPAKVYKDLGWISWGDWLGTENISSCEYSFLPFKKARAFIRTLKLKSQKEWREYSKSEKRPKHIPSSPDAVYKTEWVSTKDWLGS